MSDQPSETNELATLVGPCWTAAKVCEALKMDLGSVSSAQLAGRVLGLVTSDGDTFYPVWQFQRHGEHIWVNPDLASTFQLLRQHDSWTVAVFLHTPAPELDGHSPLRWLRLGHDPEAVTHLARLVAREWSDSRN